MTVLAKILRVVPSGYTKVVLEYDNKYEIVTILPNWNIVLKPGEQYYINILSTEAGKTKYYHNDTGEFMTHQYTQKYITEAVSAQPIHREISIYNDLEVGIK